MGSAEMKDRICKEELEGARGMGMAALSAPLEVVETFGTRARVPVRGTPNGFPCRWSLTLMDGCHRMVVNREIREVAGVQAGDSVKVITERDDAPERWTPPPS